MELLIYHGFDMVQFCFTIVKSGKETLVFIAISFYR
jgi:hypothetical protein